MYINFVNNKNVSLKSYEDLSVWLKSFNKSLKKEISLSKLMITDLEIRMIRITIIII